MVDYINQQGKWKAALPPRFQDADFEQVKRLMGARMPSVRNLNAESVPELSAAEIAALPAEFDAAEHWPKCAAVLRNIADQANCGSCWAVSAASVMADRLCIATDGRLQTSISAADIMSCCRYCGNGCNGGYPDEAFTFWRWSGVVTGSNFTDKAGCKPYPFKNCEHHTDAKTYPPCGGAMERTPRCQKSCQTGYSVHPYNKDQSYGLKTLNIRANPAAVQKELMENGPLVFTFHVFEDFLTYKSGVYEHLTGRSAGYHAVRVVGWGVENGTPYWKVANSWNEDWGDRGYFKIKRGNSECQIEDGVTTGIVDLKRTKL